MRILHTDLVPGLWIAWFIYWRIASDGVKAVRRRESPASRAAHIVPLVLSFSLIFHSDPYPIALGKIAEPENARCSKQHTELIWQFMQIGEKFFVLTPPRVPFMHE